MYENYCINDSYTLRETIEHFERNKDRVALVVNSEGKLTGVVSQGDIIRALVRGISMYAKVEQIVSHSFLHLYNRDIGEAYKIFRKTKVTLLPVVNEFNMITDVITLDDIYSFLDSKAIK